MKKKKKGGKTEKKLAEIEIEKISNQFEGQIRRKNKRKKRVNEVKTK